MAKLKLLNSHIIHELKSYEANQVIENLTCLRDIYAKSIGMMEFFTRENYILADYQKILFLQDMLYIMTNFNSIFSQQDIATLLSEKETYIASYSAFLNLTLKELKFTENKSGLCKLIAIYTFLTPPLYENTNFTRDLVYAIEINNSIELYYELLRNNLIDPALCMNHALQECITDENWRNFLEVHSTLLFQLKKDPIFTKFTSKNIPVFMIPAYVQHQSLFDIMISKNPDEVAATYVSSLAEIINCPVVVNSGTSQDIYLHEEPGHHALSQIFFCTRVIKIYRANYAKMVDYYNILAYLINKLNQSNPEQFNIAQQEFLAFIYQLYVADHEITYETLLFVLPFYITPQLCNILEELSLCASKIGLSIDFLKNIAEKYKDDKEIHKSINNQIFRLQNFANSKKFKGHVLKTPSYLSVSMRAQANNIFDLDQNLCEVIINLYTRGLFGKAKVTQVKLLKHGYHLLDKEVDDFIPLNHFFENLEDLANICSHSEQYRWKDGVFYHLSIRSLAEILIFNLMTGNKNIDFLNECGFVLDTVRKELIMVQLGYNLAASKMFKNDLSHLNNIDDMFITKNHYRSVTFNLNNKYTADFLSPFGTSLEKINPDYIADALSRYAISYNIPRETLFNRFTESAKSNGIQFNVHHKEKINEYFSWMHKIFAKCNTNYKFLRSKNEITSTKDLISERLKIKRIYKDFHDFNPEQISESNGRTNFRFYYKIYNNQSVKNTESRDLTY
ncbi:MAG: hypothetical protein J0G32_05210 [Alphaproteobacteria bacterium]|nr:hypothetical protein [Alphaproteobacteria bacterium]OJV12223.1 MAG: hypothetical protein BGO27_05755 [Alphaproteobacteria bacterium 33-17]